jgi:hypothetical protein
MSNVPWLNDSTTPEISTGVEGLDCAITGTNGNGISAATATKTHFTRRIASSPASRV